MPAKKALMTGIAGQDVSYLAEFLLGKGYEVRGIKCRASIFNTGRIDHLYQDPHDSNRKLVLHHGDLSDSSCLTRIIQQVQPDELYNLAAQSHVAVSFEKPEYTANSDALGAHCTCSNRSAFWVSKRKPISIRRARRSCMDSCRKRRSATRRSFTRAARMR